MNREGRQGREGLPIGLPSRFAVNRPFPSVNETMFATGVSRAAVPLFQFGSWGEAVSR